MALGRRSDLDACSRLETPTPSRDGSAERDVTGRAKYEDLRR